MTSSLENDTASHAAGLGDPVQVTPPATGIRFYGGYPVYSDTGVDLTLLKTNLTRSVEERWENNVRMLPFLAALRDSARAKSRETSNLWRVPMLDIPGLLQQLTNHRADYVVIGGLAMIAHGSAYITKDLDICYSRTAQNLGAIAEAFASLHAYMRGAPPGPPFRFDVATIQAGLNFTLTTDLGDIDLLGEVAGIGYYEQVLAQSEERTVLGLPVRVLTLDGLIAAKKAAGRVKDRSHLLELEELKKLRDNPQ
jgi:predicted nucleotidyltransferase